MQAGASIRFNSHLPAGTLRSHRQRIQKGIDQSQSVNLFFGDTGMRPLSHMYRAAWRKGLKTTYYLRTKSATNIEKATSKVEKEKRGIVGTHAASVAAAQAPPAPTPPKKNSPALWWPCGMAASARLVSSGSLCLNN